MYTMETYDNHTEFVERTEGKLDELLLKAVKAHQDISLSCRTYILLDLGTAWEQLIYTVCTYTVEPWQSPVVGEQETRKYILVTNEMTGEETRITA